MIEALQDEGRVLSAGQGKRSIDDLLAVLQAHEVEFLIDVRSKPYSKWQPWFSKKPLQASLKEAGIGYLFLGEGLGGYPQDLTCLTEDGRVDYEKVRATEVFQAALARVVNAFEQGRIVCLFCSEGDPANCHRSLMVGEALAALEVPIQVEHIGADDQLEVQKSVARRARIQRYGGNLRLFGSTGFTSRKSVK